MTYAAGFAEGERQAFTDRREGINRRRPMFPSGEWERGYWDAYAPRSPSWHRTPQVRHKWQERADLQGAEA